MGGGICWKCHQAIRQNEGVSLIAHLTSFASRLGFLHSRCGPPQVLDHRRNRLEALRAANHLREVSSDVQAFVAVREYPAPHGMLIISPETPRQLQGESGDLMSVWLNDVFEHGFTLAMPDVLDATPDDIPGWEIRAIDGLLTCASNDETLFEGTPERPNEWNDILHKEGKCLVLVAALGVSTNELGWDTARALNELARQGLVACGCVAAVNF